jgi:hypothetical protein
MDRRYWSGIIVMVLAFLALQTACATWEIQEAGVNNLLLRWESDRSWVKVGETVRMRFRVTNVGQQLIVYETADHSVLDITVEDVNSQKLILSWSSQNPDKVLHRVEWIPGESQVLELQWTPDEEFQYGRLVHIGGHLRANSKIIQSVGAMVCAGPACR